jgi:hypothetical protein
MKSIVFDLDSVTAYCKTNKPARSTKYGPSRCELTAVASLGWNSAVHYSKTWWISDAFLLNDTEGMSTSCRPVRSKTHTLFDS